MRRNADLSEHSFSSKIINRVSCRMSRASVRGTSGSGRDSKRSPSPDSPYNSDGYGCGKCSQSLEALESTSADGAAQRPSILGIANARDASRKAPRFRVSFKSGNNDDEGEEDAIGPLVV